MAGVPFHALDTYLTKLVQHGYNVAICEQTTQPGVGIEMPAHGLTLEETMDSVESMVEQTYPVRNVYIMYNDLARPQLATQIAERLQWLGNYRVHLRVMEVNGKRPAMAAGFREILNDPAAEFVVNIDGDTTLDPDAIAHGIRIMQQFPNVAGITSNVKLRNRFTNWLTQITAQRYDYANRLERGAQSFFYQVSCMSGPYMMLRASVLREVLAQPEDWEELYFFGEKVGPGDDRQMTSNLIKRGCGVVYVPDIVVWTDCPEDVPKWRLQQLRWARSGLREFVIANMQGWMWRLNWWSILDMFYLALFPFFLATVVLRIVGITAYVAVTQSVVAAIGVIAPYILVTLIVNAIRTLYGMYVNKDLSYWRSFFYLWIHIKELMWIKIKAIMTLTNSSWLTRTQGGDIAP